MKLSPSNKHNIVRSRIFYGIGAIAFGVKGNGLNFLLLYFYSQILGLPADMVSFGLFIAILVDSISDPLIGLLSDRFRSKLGRRHPFMYLFGLPAGIAYYYLWSPPSLETEQLFVYFLTVTILARTLMTFYEVPSVALGPELTLDYDERTKFAATRYFFGWWGGLTMALLVYFVFLPEAEGGMSNLDGWQNYGMVAATVIVLSTYICGFGLHSQIPFLTQPQDKSNSFRELLSQVRQSLANKQFIALFASASFFAMGAGVFLSLSIYFGRHFWGLSTEQLGYLQLPLFLSALIALLVAPIVSNNLGKKKAALITVVLWLLIAPLPIVLRLTGAFPSNDSDILLPILMLFAFIETSLAIMIGVYLSAMFADIVEDSQVETKARSEGLYYSASSFTQKALNSVGVLIAGQLLTYVEFPTSAVQQDVSEATITKLAIITIAVLSVVYLAAITSLMFYKIDKSTHNKNLNEISREQKK